MKDAAPSIRRNVKVTGASVRVTPVAEAMAFFPPSKLSVFLAEIVPGSEQ
jgi:hypothetical protein